MQRQERIGYPDKLKLRFNLTSTLLKVFLLCCNLLKPLDGNVFEPGNPYDLFRMGMLISILRSLMVDYQNNYYARTQTELERNVSPGHTRVFTLFNNQDDLRRTMNDFTLNSVFLSFATLKILNALFGLATGKDVNYIQFGLSLILAIKVRQDLRQNRQQNYGADDQSYTAPTP